MAIARDLPTRNADGSAVVLPSRTGPYLEAYTIGMGAGNWAFADEGSYFHASNATLATGIAGHAAPVVADVATKPLVHLYNGGSKNVVLDYLFLEVTAAGTAGTLHYTTIYLDNDGATSRASGGTAITPVNCNSGSSDDTSATLYFGAVVATGTDKVAQQIVREVIPVVQDTVLMKFGSGFGSGAGLTTAGTATNHKTQNFAPIVVAPGGNIGISQIRPSQSAASSYQFSMGWWER